MLAARSWPKPPGLTGWLALAVEATAPVIARADTAVMMSLRMWCSVVVGVVRHLCYRPPCRATASHGRAISSAGAGPARSSHRRSMRRNPAAPSVATPDSPGAAWREAVSRPFLRGATERPYGRPVVGAGGPRRGTAQQDQRQHTRREPRCCAQLTERLRPSLMSGATGISGYG